MWAFIKMGLQPWSIWHTKNSDVSDKVL